MGLPSTFPWQCAALTCLPAVVLSAIAIGLPMWSQFPGTNNNDYEYGMWENCVISNGVRSCGTEWQQPGNQCYGLILSLQVTSLLGISFLFLGMLVCCALFKKVVKALAALAFCLLFLAVAFMITAFSLWIGIAEAEKCFFGGNKLRNYGPSFIMQVVATALAAMAMCLTCFGLLGALKMKKTPKETYVEEPVYYPVVQQAAYPEANFYSSYPTTTYPATSYVM